MLNDENCNRDLPTNVRLNYGNMFSNFLLFLAITNQVLEYYYLPICMHRFLPFRKYSEATFDRCKIPGFMNIFFNIKNQQIQNTCKVILNPWSLVEKSSAQ